VYVDVVGGDGAIARTKPRAEGRTWFGNIANAATGRETVGKIIIFDDFV